MSISAAHFSGDFGSQTITDSLLMLKCPCNITQPYRISTSKSLVFPGVGLE